MAQSASKQRLLNHYVAMLPDDVNGVADGHRYNSFLDTADMHAYKSLRGGKEGVWSGRTHLLASLDEHHVFSELEANPYVLSIRENYPFWPADVIDDLEEGRPIARNRVMTVDFVLTLPPKTFSGPLRYHGLYRKPSALSDSPASKRRKEKESQVLAERGWSWNAVSVPSPTRVASLLKLREWAKAGPIDSVHADAVELSNLLYKTTSVKALHGVLRLLGKRLGVSVSDQYFVFAAAFYFGYVNVVKDAVLDEDFPLMLAPRVLHPFGVHVRG